MGWRRSIRGAPVGGGRIGSKNASGTFPGSWPGLRCRSRCHTSGDVEDAEDGHVLIEIDDMRVTINSKIKLKS